MLDRSVNAGVVGFRGSTQPTMGNPTFGGFMQIAPIPIQLYNDVVLLRAIK